MGEPERIWALWDGTDGVLITYEKKWPASVGYVRADLYDELRRGMAKIEALLAAPTDYR